VTGLYQDALELFASHRVALKDCYTHCKNSRLIASVAILLARNTDAHKISLNLRKMPVIAHSGSSHRADISR
jgi:hypothetical protein